MALLVAALLIAVQVGVSFLVRTHRMRGYLIAHLESAFGRPVQVGSFSVQILPIPELDVDAVTIAEDPAFGYEYFLRAEHMTARFRWLGLLRGHFEFGTMSLTRPSLILVRNAAGRWNLEGWLPPARRNLAGGSTTSRTQEPPESTQRLQKIDFDEGRINFKVQDEKRPFAFTNVSGSVEQVSPGRWELRLEAQPWRSGVALQSTGTLQVVGDVAGTSARLQPAQIRLHWGRVSLADLFRLVTGNDSGVRGEFALDGNASVGLDTPSPEAASNPWRFVLQARAAQIHRWDLTERDDNPRVNVNVKGQWDVVAGEVRAEELRVELPRSSLNGSGVLETAGPANWHAQFKNMAVQGEDLLAWCRAFQPGIGEEVALEDLITGTVTASGWPLQWERIAIASTGGTLRVPGLAPAHIDPFRGSVRNGKSILEGLRLKLLTEALQPGSDRIEKGSAKTRAVATPENTIEASLVHDSVAHQGGLRLNLRLGDATRLFKLSAAFGRTLNKGWEYTGGAVGFLAWNWGTGVKEAHRSGSIELTKAQLQVAGLNEPLKVEQTRLEWKDGQRSATIGKADAFGATWSGSISEAGEEIGGEERNWLFQLHADHLEGAELDRWFGPRARPNWLQRLSTSLLGETNTAAGASELLRRVSAEGELTAGTLTVEKVKLANARAMLSLHALHLEVRDAEAEWAGGKVRGRMQALFSPAPQYEISAEFESVNLAQLPWPARWAERWSGIASGKIHMTTIGVGREELLKQLAGSGEVKLNKIEFRGWDVESSVELGAPRTGTSHWTSGEGEFEVRERSLHFDTIQMEAPHARTKLAGAISFDMDGNFTFSPGVREKRGARTTLAARQLRVSGPLETPVAAVQPARDLVGRKLGTPQK
jgi:hypothetical protein